MKKILYPFENFYVRKRIACFNSVQSFKYPFTKVVRFTTPAITKLSSKVTDFIQMIRLYEMSYVAVRTIDDIADEGSITDATAHMESIVKFLNSESNPQNENEVLLQYIFDTASIVGRDVEAIATAFNNIFVCVQSDSFRRMRYNNQQTILRNEDEIEKYIRQMELEGIFCLLFELYGEKNYDLEKYWPLVCAGRLHFYLLRDVVEDIASGLINVPKRYLPEDISNLINYCQTLEQTSDTNMEERLLKINKMTEEFPILTPWIELQISEGQRLLNVHQKITKKELKLRTKILLLGSYKRTKKFFKQAEKVLL